MQLVRRATRVALVTAAAIALTGASGSSAALAAPAADQAAPATVAPAAAPAPAAAATPSGFTFAAAGDHASGPGAAAVFRSVGARKPHFFLSLGDLSYDTVSPATWCQSVVKDNINAGAGLPRGSAYGQNFPVALTEGNHDHATYGSYVAASCLPPSRVGAVNSPHASYGKEYHFDYPAGAPLARVIVTSPGVSYSYAPGSPRYTWLRDTIRAAKARGLWVIVANHKQYVTAGTKGNEIGSAYFNLLVAERAHLILQGHDHTYQRSKQFAFTPGGCTSVPSGRTDYRCLSDDGADGAYAASNGPVLAISGVGGQHRYPINASDPERGYFTRLMGANIGDAAGYLSVAVTPSAINASFVRTGGGSFADSFRITRPDTTAPSVPTGLRGSAAGGTVNLTWGASTDDRFLSGYRVYRDGVLVASMGFRTTSYSYAPGPGSHTYTVRAFDAAGNVSGPSNAVTVAVP